MVKLKDLPRRHVQALVGSYIYAPTRLLAKDRTNKRTNALSQLFQSTHYLTPFTQNYHITDAGEYNWAYFQLRSQRVHKVSATGFKIHKKNTWMRVAILRKFGSV